MWIYKLFFSEKSFYDLLQSLGDELLDGAGVAHCRLHSCNRRGSPALHGRAAGQPAHDLGGNLDGDADRGVTRGVQGGHPAVPCGTES